MQEDYCEELDLFSATAKVTIVVPANHPKLVRAKILKFEEGYKILRKQMYSSRCYKRVGGAPGSLPC